MLSNILDL